MKIRVEVEIEVVAIPDEDGVIRNAAEGDILDERKEMVLGELKEIFTKPNFEPHDAVLLDDGSFSDMGIAAVPKSCNILKIEEIK